MGRFIKLPQHRRFEFKPRFYDERKEELDQRIQRIKEEVELEKKLKESGENYTINYRSTIRDQFQRNRKTKKISNIRFLLILVALLGLAYYLIYM